MASPTPASSPYCHLPVLRLLSPDGEEVEGEAGEEPAAEMKAEVEVEVEVEVLLSVVVVSHYWRMAVWGFGCFPFPPLRSVLSVLPPGIRACRALVTSFPCRVSSVTTASG